MSSIQAILEAATTLSKIPEVERHDLLAHRKELESAFYNLRMLLQSSASPATFSPPDASDAPATSSPATSAPPDVSDAPATFSPATPAPTSTEATSDVPPSASVTSSALADAHDNGAYEAESLPDKVLKVMDRLKKCEKEILTYAYQPAECAVSSGTDWASEDPRIVDICLTTKNRDADVKFRAGLSALSLADDYTKWERSSYETTRIETLYNDLNMASNAKDAHYKEYVSICADRFKNKSKAQKGIEYGVKFRVFEKFYSQSGVLVLLFFVYGPFRDLKYEYLPKLADAIRKSEWDSRARERNAWLDSCLKDHEARILKVSHIQKHVLEVDGITDEHRKRQRLEHSITQRVPENTVRPDMSVTLATQEPQQRHIRQEDPSDSRLSLPDFNPLDHPNYTLSQNMSSSSLLPLQDFNPLDHPNFIVSQNMSSGTLLPLPDFNPLEHSNHPIPQNTTSGQHISLESLSPLVPQDIEAAVTDFLSNLDPRNHTHDTRADLQETHIQQNSTPFLSRLTITASTCAS